MAALKEDVKLFIVHSLACFMTPTQVADVLRKEYGIEVTRMQVQAYDPDKVIGKRLSEKWIAEFRKMRDDFLSERQKLAVSHQNYRLSVLDRMVKKAETAGNMQLTAQLLEQAAKEIGEVYVNRHREPQKPPGADASVMPTQPEYVLKPDEPTPAKPIL